MMDDEGNDAKCYASFNKLMNMEYIAYVYSLLTALPRALAEAAGS